MNQTEWNILLGVVFVVGLVWSLKNTLPYVGNMLGKLKSVATTVKDSVVDEVVEVKVSSDSPPPEGFVEHVKIIKSASHAASADVRESYYEKGLTFAETLKAEYDRVTNTKKVDEPVKPEKNVEAK